METKRQGQILTGTVVSNKTAKTVTVEVVRLVRHPKYGKFLKRSKRYLVHDETGHQIGERVTIEETRPISRRKHFKIKQK